VPDLDHYQQQVAQAEARASAAEQAAASLASQLEALQGRVQVAEARLAGSQRQVELLAQALAEAREKACDEDMLVRVRAVGGVAASMCGRQHCTVAAAVIHFSGCTLGCAASWYSYVCVCVCVCVPQAELQEALAASEAQLEAAEREVGAGQREIWERERTIKNLAVSDHSMIAAEVLAQSARNGGGCTQLREGEHDSGREGGLPCSCSTEVRMQCLLPGPSLSTVCRPGWSRQRLSAPAWGHV
jgi:hypothetical protein